MAHQKIKEEKRFRRVGGFLWKNGGFSGSLVF
jgi:hypothetical protein